MRRCFLLTTIMLVIAFSALMLWGLDRVDIEASEDIYLADSIGYIRHDPFIVPRHHLRKPHFPASPHPFFWQMAQAEIFKIFGVSISSARLLSVISAVLSLIILMYLTWILTKSGLVYLFSGLVFSLIPLVVRFGRMAILDPSLMLIQTAGVLWLWLSTQNKNKIGYLFGILTGVALGISSSIKLSGIFWGICIFLWIFYLFYTERDKYYLNLFIIILFSFAATFLLFNDPRSYIYGWTHFSDPKSGNISLLAMIKGLTAFRYWNLFIPELLGIITFILFIFGFLYLIKMKNKSAFFLFSWFLAPTSYLIFNPPHVTGLSAEWSYMPLMPVIAVISGFGFSQIWTKLRQLKRLRFILLSIYIVTASFSVWSWGLRMRPLPLASFLHARNVVDNNRAVTNLITALNREENEQLVLVNFNSVGFPLWLLKNNIRTEPRYHNLADYDYIATDNTDLINEAKLNNFSAVYQSQNPTEFELFLLKRTNPSKPMIHAPVSSS